MHIDEIRATTKVPLVYNLIQPEPATLCGRNRGALGKSPKECMEFALFHYNKSTGTKHPVHQASAQDLNWLNTTA